MNRFRGTLLLAFTLFASLAVLKIYLTSNGPGRSVSYPFGQTFYQENLFMTTIHRGQKSNFWEAPLPKCSAVINTTSLESNQSNRWHEHLSHLEKYEIKLLKDDPVCLKNICPNTSFCFLGACFCHPGYEGEECSSRKIPGNPWYTESCPNLLSPSTADMTVPLHMLGGEYSQGNHVPEEGSGGNSSFSLSVPVRNKCVGSSNPTACAYLCYSHSAYGTAVVPHSLWQAAQDAEGGLWVKQSIGTLSAQNDRAQEHWTAFNSFEAVSLYLSHGNSLGRVIEVGAGPWTQFKGILHHRPEFAESVAEFVVWEPNAKGYMKGVSSCSYRNGYRLYKWDGNGTYAFQTKVQSDGGELLSKNYFSNNNSSIDSNQESLNITENVNTVQYDTVISINVIEHTQDAFKYLTGLYLALKDNGLLIFHERYYKDSDINKGDLYHPIRIKRIILDRFLMGFDVLYNNCSANYEGRRGEEGYYVIARKLSKNDFNF